eukprot:gene19983-biopygen5545
MPAPRPHQCPVPRAGPAGSGLGPRPDGAKMKKKCRGPPPSGSGPGPLAPGRPAGPGPGPPALGRVRAASAAVFPRGPPLRIEDFEWH